MNCFHHTKTFECQGLAFPPKLLCCRSEACQTKERLCSNMSVLPRERMSPEVIRAAALQEWSQVLTALPPIPFVSRGAGCVLEYMPLVVGQPHRCRGNPGKPSQLHHKFLPNRGVQVVCKHGCRNNDENNKFSPSFPLRRKGVMLRPS